MKKELIVKWKINKDATSKVMDLLPSLGEKSKSEKGNNFYAIYQNDNDPTELILYEIYEDEQALEAHKNSEHYQEIVVKEIIPHLSIREVYFVNKIF